MILGSLAGTWIDEQAALAHYRACDKLALTAAERVSVGQQTGRGLQQHITRLVGAVSKSTGATPWWFFEHFNRFWARSFDNKNVSVIKLGPKEAEVHSARCSLLESSYFRAALRGVATGILSVVTQRCFMNELTPPSRGDDARYRVSWV